MAKTTARFNYESLAGAIAGRRRALKLSLREAEAQIGLSASTLSRIERQNFSDAGVDTYLALCEWLEVPITAFIVGSPLRPANMAIEIEKLIYADSRISKQKRAALVKIITVAYENIMGL
jgi:transcriptional regulator with XRE-family HTH domain